MLKRRKQKKGPLTFDTVYGFLRPYRKVLWVTIKCRSIFNVKA